MAKTFAGKTKEQQGSLPACTGALLEIASLEIGKTREAKHKMYTLDFVVKEPKELKGSHCRDWIVVGTDDDPRAKQKETWERSEAGPGRIARLFTRAGVGMVDDDEEWDGLLSGSEVVAPITRRKDDGGEWRNRVGLFFRPTDDDCPEIGLDTEEDGKGRRGKGAAGAGKKARGRKVDDEDEEETDEDEDEKPKGKKKAKAEEDEEEEDEDEKPKSRKGKKPKADDDEDDD